VSLTCLPTVPQPILYYGAFALFRGSLTPVDTAFRLLFPLLPLWLGSMPERNTFSPWALLTFFGLLRSSPTRYLFCSFHTPAPPTLGRFHFRRMVCPFFFRCFPPLPSSKTTCPPPSPATRVFVWHRLHPSSIFFLPWTLGFLLPLIS